MKLSIRIVFLFVFTISGNLSWTQDIEANARHIVMIHGAPAPGAPVKPEGAGFIVGATDKRLYIATAEHVIRGQGGRDLENLTVFIKNRSGEPIKAEPLTYRDIERDLAVIAVDLSDYPKLKLEIEEATNIVGTLRSEAPSGIYVLGYAEGRPWAGNKTAEPLLDSDPVYVAISSKAIEPGHSGGGAFDEHGRLVGMVIEEKGDKARILRTAEIVDTLVEWGIPVSRKLLNPLEAGPPPQWVANYAKVEMITFMQLQPDPGLFTAILILSGDDTNDVAKEVEFSLYEVSPDNQPVNLVSESFNSLQELRSVKREFKTLPQQLISCTQHATVNGEGYIHDIVYWTTSNTSLSGMINYIYEKAEPSQPDWSQDRQSCTQLTQAALDKIPLEIEEKSVSRDRLN